MPDSITLRVSRILVGGAHALLDKAENIAPEALMQQSLREIEQVIGEVRVDLGKAEAAKHLVLSRIASLNAEHESLSESAEVAVAEGRDDLAHSAIGRQTDIEDLLSVLRKSLDEHVEKSKELESYITALLAKRREFETLLSDYRESAKLVEGDNLEVGGDRQNRVESATASFDRVMARQVGSGLGAGMLRSASDAEKLKELAELQRNNRIAERLAVIKAAKIGK